MAAISITDRSSGGSECSQPEDPCESIDCNRNDGVPDCAVFANKLDANQVGQDKDCPERGEDIEVETGLHIVEDVDLSNDWVMLAFTRLDVLLSSREG